MKPVPFDRDKWELYNVAEGRIERTNAFKFSADETADVGVDEATTVTDDYKDRDNKFTGRVLKATVEPK